MSLTNIPRIFASKICSYTTEENAASCLFYTFEYHSADRSRGRIYVTSNIAVNFFCRDPPEATFICKCNIVFEVANYKLFINIDGQVQEYDDASSIHIGGRIFSFEIIPEKMSRILYEYFSVQSPPLAEDIIATLAAKTYMFTPKMPLEYDIDAGSSARRRGITNVDLDISDGVEICGEIYIYFSFGLSCTYDVEEESFENEAKIHNDNGKKIRDIRIYEKGREVFKEKCGNRLEIYVYDIIQEIPYVDRFRHAVEDTIEDYFCWESSSSSDSSSSIEDESGNLSDEDKDESGE